MITITFPIVLLVLLAIISIIDWKFKAVPSILLTSIIFITAVTHFKDLDQGVTSISFGILAFIFAYFLYEADFIKGVADIKFIVIIGLMISTISMFFVSIILIMLYGIAYKMVFYFLFKDESIEIPFIPALYSVYVVLFILGGVA